MASPWPTRKRRRQRTQELELAARHAELAQRDRVQAHAERVAETNRLHAERTAADARVDAEARRITELYIKASEQLGSDKAPVRMAGFYALERLAQDNEGQRQTVVDVLCAYLRMPYGDHAQEREVRLTGLGVLESHLRPGDDPDHSLDTFWRDIDLNLSRCRVRTRPVHRRDPHRADLVRQRDVRRARPVRRRSLGPRDVHE
ncbi:hypothetical protein [Amycolatopsis sp. CA-230715]|uniref:hypothetical protein n=1 Tax=Amycolatopsis sp. CA-230715 TaxID=2745196 RepID=UPI001C3333B0|nr:hypothetical protein HUW46_07732 [Amycolatopsis sp. CA-230715]